MTFHSQLLLHKVHQMRFQAKMEDTVRQEIHMTLTLHYVQYGNPAVKQTGLWDYFKFLSSYPSSYLIS